MQEEQEIRAELLEQSSAFPNRIVQFEQVEKAPRKSERKWLLLKNPCDVVLNLDRDGTILFINPTLPGYTIEDTIGITVYDFIPPKQHKKTRKAIKEVFKTGEVVSFETSVFGPDGSLLRYSTHLSPVKNCDKVVCVAQVFTNITKRKKVEEALRKSENKYRTLLENLPQKIFLKDRNSVYVSCNENYARDLHIKAEEIVGKTDYEFYPEELAEKYRADDKRIMQSGETRDIEERYIKDGQEIVVQTVKTPVKDEWGNVIGVLGIFRDITERKKSEEEIKKLSTAVEHSIDGIAIGDLELKLIYINHAFAQMHGYTPEDMVGMPVTKLYNKEQIDEHKRAMNQLRKQDSWEGEIGHIRKDRTAFPTYASITLLKNSEGKPTGTLAILRDITGTKLREEKFNIYKEKMARAEQLASLGTFSASVAHELTQPLTVIRLSIENSLAELDTISYPSTIEEDLKEGLNEISNVISIVDRFHDFARRSSETTVVEVVLKATAERIMDLLDESAWRAKVLLRVEGMDKLPPIYSHEKELEQLFYSLVENAIQAADGKKSRQVIISGVARNEHIELQFSDNCGGIAPENLDRIFEPFFTTKPASEGTGLGLCVVKRIVSLLNGIIRVESKLGKGSTFFVTLPIKGDGR